MKEIHFYTELEDIFEVLSSPDNCFAFTWDETEDLIAITNERPNGILHTYSMAHLVCAANLLTTGWRIFIHDKTGSYEVTLGCYNERTRRKLEPWHNFFKLWISGEFEKKRSGN